MKHYRNSINKSKNKTKSFKSLNSTVINSLNNIPAKLLKSYHIEVIPKKAKILIVISLANRKAIRTVTLKINQSKIVITRNSL